MAAGPMVTAAAATEPAAARCHIDSHAWYGALATVNTRPEDRALSPLQASHPTAIGRHHSAPVYSLRGGQPSSQASSTPYPATSDTGAAATTIPSVTAAFSSRQASRRDRKSTRLNS